MLKIGYLWIVVQFSETDFQVILLILAHLCHTLKVSYCHQPMSVVYRATSIVRRQQFALNDNFPVTTRRRSLVFGMKHCLVDLYKVC